MIDYYGTEVNTIHLKWGDMLKCYNFTDKFRAKHPAFCAEYDKYWIGDKTCRFKTGLEIAQYVDMFRIPVKFYFNYTDKPVKKMAEVYEYFIREYAGITKEVDGSYRADYQNGLDGEKKKYRAYRVEEVK